MATTRITDIVAIAARLSGLERQEITGVTRMRYVIRVRQAAMYLAHETGAHSSSQIGRVIGGRDHSTVLHGIRQARNFIERDPEYAHFINRVRDEMEAASPFLEGWGEQFEFALPYVRKTKPKPDEADEADETPLYYGGGYSMNREMAA